MEQPNEVVDFYKLNGEQFQRPDSAGYISSEFADDTDEEDGEDIIFNNIKKSVVSGASENDLVFGDGSVASLDRTGKDVSSLAHNSLVFGFIPKGCYTHPRKNGALLGICHNPRYRQFLVLDAKGITSWKYDCRTGPPVVRQLNYPSYQYRLYSNLVYDKKHNVYFCLGKDFSLKILNHQFQETYTVEANLRNVMFLLYNPKREELITGGVGGSKVWQFVQVVEDKGWTEVKAMSNYKLQHKYTLRNVGGGWVKKVTMDHKLSHLYCCSETDLHAYNLNNGDELFSISRAHAMSITGCVYSTSAQYIVTSSNDTTVKCWIVNGGLVHTFRVHTKPVTQIMSHPQVASLILTCSADCSIKLLCLDTLNVLYSITVSTDGVHWMGLTHENIMWACTSTQVTMWNLNHFIDFFSLSRARVHKLSLQSAPNKSTRLLAVGDDSCARLFSAHTQRHLCNVLPMPSLSALEKVKCVTYSRELNLVYCLLNRSSLWIYTTRTDPACRIAQWDVRKIQDNIINREEDLPEGARKEALLRKASLHKAVADMHVNVEVCDCTTIATLNSPILAWSDEGWVGTVPTKFLLLGLTDGRVLFMDPFVRGLLHVDFRANKDAIQEIRHDSAMQQLLTQCSRNEVSIVQIWGLPTLQLQHELCLYPDITSTTRLGDKVCYGYSDGSVSFHNLEEVEEDNINRRTNQIKNKEELRLSGLVQKKVEHKGTILNVDSCSHRQLFLTSSVDTMVKIWSAGEECVIADVTLDDSLSCAIFLNSSADIVLGFANNLYTIDFNIVCPTLAAADDSQAGYAESITAESDIYEDPAITYERVIPNPDPLDLLTYLKPYELDITKDFLEATDIVVRPQTREKEDEEESEILSNAPTDIYESEYSTPRLSRMELFTPEPLNWDQLSTHSGRASTVKSATSDADEKPSHRQKVFDKLDVTNPEHAEYYLPMFGDSPGGTPSISSEESLADSRSDLDDISEMEFGTDYGSDEEPVVAAKPKTRKGSVAKAAKSLTKFSFMERPFELANQQLPPAKKKKAKAAPLSLTLASDDDDELTAGPNGRAAIAYKYGVDKMKIDVGALMKQGQKKGSKKVTMSSEPPQVRETMEEQLENVALRQALQAGASELSSKKKKAAGARKRAPAKKQSAAPPVSSKKPSAAASEAPKLESSKAASQPPLTTKPDKSSSHVTSTQSIAGKAKPASPTSHSIIPEHLSDTYSLTTSAKVSRQVRSMARHMIRSAGDVTQRSHGTASARGRSTSSFLSRYGLSATSLGTDTTHSQVSAAITSKGSPWNGELINVNRSMSLRYMQGKVSFSAVTADSGNISHLELPVRQRSRSNESGSYIIDNRPSSPLEVERVLSSDRMKMRNVFGKKLRKEKIRRVQLDSINVKVERDLRRMSMNSALARDSVSDTDIARGGKTVHRTVSETLYHVPLLVTLMEEEVVNSSKSSVNVSALFTDSITHTELESLVDEQVGLVVSEDNASLHVARSESLDTQEAVAVVKEGGNENEMPSIALVKRNSGHELSQSSVSRSRLADTSNLLLRLVSLKRKRQKKMAADLKLSSLTSSDETLTEKRLLNKRDNSLRSPRQLRASIERRQRVGRIGDTHKENELSTVASQASLTSSVVGVVSPSLTTSPTGYSLADVTSIENEPLNLPNVEPSWQFVNMLSDAVGHVNMLREMFAHLDHKMCESDLIQSLVTSVGAQSKTISKHNSLALEIDDALSTGRDEEFFTLWKPYFSLIASTIFAKAWSRYSQPAHSPHKLTLLWSHSPTYKQTKLTPNITSSPPVRAQNIIGNSGNISTSSGLESSSLENIGSMRSISLPTSPAGMAVLPFKTKKSVSYTAAQSKQALDELMSMPKRYDIMSAVKHLPRLTEEFQSFTADKHFSRSGEAAPACYDDKHTLHTTISPKSAFEDPPDAKPQLNTPVYRNAEISAGTPRSSNSAMWSLADGVEGDFDSKLKLAKMLEGEIDRNRTSLDELDEVEEKPHTIPIWQVIVARQKLKRMSYTTPFPPDTSDTLADVANGNSNNNAREDTVEIAVEECLNHLGIMAASVPTDEVLSLAFSSFVYVMEKCSHEMLQLSALDQLSVIWHNISVTHQLSVFEQLCQAVSSCLEGSVVQAHILALLLTLLKGSNEKEQRLRLTESLCTLSKSLSDRTVSVGVNTLPLTDILEHLQLNVDVCKALVVAENSLVVGGLYGGLWHPKLSLTKKVGRIQKSTTRSRHSELNGSSTERVSPRPTTRYQNFLQPRADLSAEQLTTTGETVNHLCPSSLNSLPSSFHHKSVYQPHLSMSSVSGDLISGLIPAPSAAASPKKAAPKRKGKIIDAKAAPSYPSEMVKVAIGDEDLRVPGHTVHQPLSLQSAAFRKLRELVLVYEFHKYLLAVSGPQVTHDHVKDRLDDIEDDVDLSRYMHVDDDMDCKSAASWNPKFDFEAPSSRSRENDPDLKALSPSVRDLPTSSARVAESRDGLSAFETPDSRMRLTTTRRTPGLSERMSDIDGLSVQMDAYDDVVEDRVTPQHSVSESAVESLTRSGMSPVRLPNLMPDLEEDMGVPAQSDALSRWLMGSMPRAGSALESEIQTRPGTTYSEMRPSSRDVRSRLSAIDSKGILKVSPFLKSRLDSQNERGRRPIHVTIDDGSQASTEGYEARPTSAAHLTSSKMLGQRHRRPHTAPTITNKSYEDLQEAFDEALLKFQGDTDINKLFKQTQGAYTDNWQDKLIERHKLLSMQKEIRAKSAVARRQAVQQKLMDKRHSLLGHRHCDGVIDPATDEGRHISESKITEARMRTNSAIGKPLISVSLKEARLQSAKSSGALESSSPLMEKASVINESQVQYRFRINESFCEKLHNNLKPTTPQPPEREPDSVSYDPRRPNSVRRPGTRSIPSRCTRFVLVKQKKANNRPTSPTPLEKQLLSKRFPSFANRVIPNYISNSTLGKTHQPSCNNASLSAHS